VQVHPVHKTFLLFYQAICYESLGHIAHNYSSNKIPLFEQARDAFTSASETLSLPFLTTLGGQYDALGSSPVCATSDVLALYKADSPSVYSTPSPIKHSTHRRHSTSVTSPSMTGSIRGVRVAHAVPDFNDYSPRLPIGTILSVQQLMQSSTNKDDANGVLTSEQRAESHHKARLSRSLSSQHALAENLIPSPLFSRGPTCTKESQSETSTDTDGSLPLVTLSKPLPPTPVNRALPALPFNHQPHFVLKGKRFVVVPRRKTALATLISRFERRSPFDSPTPRGSTGKELVLYEQTPTTERFQRISSTFVEKQNADSSSDSTAQPYHALQEPKTSNETARYRPRPADSERHSSTHPVHNQGTIPSTPCPKPRQRQRQQQRSSVHHHLQAYNTHLSSLHTALRTHIASVTASISQTGALQLAHEDDKRRRFADMRGHPGRRGRRHAAGSGPASHERGDGDRGARDRDKDVRLRSFWSLQIRDTVTGAGGGGGDEEKKRARKERIERLRGQEWEGVRKERFGWKGSEYYEGLRGRAERDLVEGVGS